MKQNPLQAMAGLSLCTSASAQVNSGSNGSHGAFNPTTNIVSNSSRHLDGMCQSESVGLRGKGFC